MNPTLKVSHRMIGIGQAPFIIAEMSGNHQGSLKKALEIVDVATKTGADALKIQTYTADTMTIDVKRPDFYVTDPKSPWKGRSLYNLYREAHTPWEWHKPIFDRCKKNGILGFSTPFDSTSVDFLESLNVPLYKIASFENIDLPLIRRVAKTGKPMIISTGMASEVEIGDAVKAARGAGCKNLILLKCTSAYPADASEANLKTIPHMAKKFDCLVGISDHTRGIGVSVTSVGYGAVAIERHLTIDRNSGGVDASFSLEPAEMKMMVGACRDAHACGGSVKYGPSEREKKSLCFRRSIFIVKNVNKGDVFTKSNVRCIRPGYGLPPKYFDAILGKKALRGAKKGTPFQWKYIKHKRTKT